MKIQTRKMILMSLMISAALVLSFIESMIPMPSVIPGAKIGLANIVTLLALLTLKPNDAFMVLNVRIILGSVFVGGFSGFLYSAGGGLLSFVMMFTVLKLLKGKVGTVGVSVTGAYFHSLGQVVVAIILVHNWRIVLYLPMILAVSIAAGIFVGMITQVLLSHKTIDKLFKTSV